MLLVEKCDEKLMFSLCGEEFFALVISCVFTPSKVGFSLESQFTNTTITPNQTELKRYYLPSSRCSNICYVSNPSSTVVGIYNRLPQVTDLTSRLCNILAKELDEVSLEKFKKVL